MYILHEWNRKRNDKRLLRVPQNIPSKCTNEWKENIFLESPKRTKVASKGFIDVLKRETAPSQNADIVNAVLLTKSRPNIDNQKQLKHRRRCLLVLLALIRDLFSSKAQYLDKTTN